MRGGGGGRGWAQKAKYNKKIKTVLNYHAYLPIFINANAF